MSNETNGPTFTPTAAPTVGASNETTTDSPTVSPTVENTGETTESPTFSPTPALTEDPGLPTFSPTAPPTNNTDVEVIRLPSYKSKDPVDGIFIVVVVVMTLAVVGSCLHSINRRKNREKKARVRQMLEAELSVNEEDGDKEIRLRTNFDAGRTKSNTCSYE